MSLYVWAAGAARSNRGPTVLPGRLHLEHQLQHFLYATILTLDSIFVLLLRSVANDCSRTQIDDMIG